MSDPDRLILSKDGRHWIMVCMRCGATADDDADVVGNLTTFWHGTTYGVNNPAFCRQCIDDIRQFAETPKLRQQS